MNCDGDRALDICVLKQNKERFVSQLTTLLNAIWIPCPYSGHVSERVPYGVRSTIKHLFSPCLSGIQGLE